VRKTALGSTESVPSQYFKTTNEAIEQLRKKNVPIFAVELTNDSEDYRKVEYPDEVALLFGHETDGVQTNILELCDRVISVPMRGKKESLNVATVAGIVMYEAVRNVS